MKKILHWLLQRFSGSTQPRLDPLFSLTIPEDLFVLHLRAPKNQFFHGTLLMAAIGRAGLQFGDRRIFHCLDSEGRSLFSLANGIEPGCFDLDQMLTFTTPGLSFFLGLPGPENPMLAFDKMVMAAHALAEELQGELRDEKQSLLSKQTIAYYRERIRQYEQRQSKNQRIT